MAPPDATARRWDVLVVGGGPAGAIAAQEAAKAGASVLMIDKTPFPRGKVCGGCLNAESLAVLNAVGLGDLPDRYGARSLDRLHLAAGRNRAELPLPDGGAALSRTALDAALVRAAKTAGVHWLAPATATVEPAGSADRPVRVRSDGADTRIRARTILLATGLSGTALDPDAAPKALRTRPARRSRIGLGAVLDPEAAEAYPSGRIHMACGHRGYVGLVRLEDDRLDVAAALDPRFLRQTGRPGEAIAALLRECALPRLDPSKTAPGNPWRGTPRLTHRRRMVGDARLLLIGDAAGYVEPFTGEGIGWALATGAAAARLALEPRRSDRAAAGLGERWSRQYRRLLRHRQRRCRTLTLLLRQPTATRCAVKLLGRAPALAAPLVRTIHGPSGLDTAAADL